MANAGSDEWNYQVKDLAKAVANEISGTEVSINLDAPPDKRSYRVDFGLFKKLAPQNQPQVKLIEAIRELKKSLEEMHFNTTDFRDSNFVNLRAKSPGNLRVKITHL